MPSTIFSCNFRKLVQEFIARVILQYVLNNAINKNKGKSSPSALYCQSYTSAIIHKPAWKEAIEGTTSYA